MGKKELKHCHRSEFLLKPSRLGQPEFQHIQTRFKLKSELLCFPKIKLELKLPN